MKCLIKCSDVESSWVAKLMPGLYPQFLRILNKPLLEYFIDFCALNGIVDLRIVKSDPSGKMEHHFQKGPQKGLNISYEMLKTDDSLAKILKKNSKFCADDDLLIIDGFFFLNYHCRYIDMAELDRNTPASMNGGLAEDIYFLPKNYNFSELDFNSEERIFSDLSITQLDTVNNYYQLSMDILENKSDNYFLPGYSNQLGEFVGRNVVFHSHRTKFDKPFMIGNDVKIFDYSHIDSCSIIGNNVMVDSHSNIERSIIYDQSYLGSGLELHKKIVYKNHLIDPKSGDFIQVTDQFFISRINKVIESSFLRHLNKIIALLAIIIGLIPFAFAWSTKSIFGIQSTKQKYIKNEEGDEIILTKFLIKKPNIFNRLFVRFCFDKYPLLFNVLTNKLDLVGNKLIPNDSFGKLILKQLDIYCPSVISYPEVFATNVSDSEFILHEIYYNHNTSFKFMFKIIAQHKFNRFLSVRDYFKNGYFSN
ncbi:MAG: hypothetical protein KAS49_06530 [Candidatus Cloacimonetes bacterium]|nr:hypothetical protein [Candidatus Cloacimonadota bacterium]